MNKAYEKKQKELLEKSDCSGIRYRDVKTIEDYEKLENEVKGLIKNKGKKKCLFEAEKKKKEFLEEKERNISVDFVLIGCFASTWMSYIVSLFSILIQSDDLEIVKDIILIASFIMLLIITVWVIDFEQKSANIGLKYSNLKVEFYETICEIIKNMPDDEIIVERRKKTSKVIKSKKVLELIILSKE